MHLSECVPPHQRGYVPILVYTCRLFPPCAQLELQWREEHHAYQGRGDELVPPDIVAKAKRAEASPRHQLGAPTVDDDFDNDEDDDSDDDDEGAGGGATGLRKSGRED